MRESCLSKKTRIRLFVVCIRAVADNRRDAAARVARSARLLGNPQLLAHVILHCI